MSEKEKAPITVIGWGGWDDRYPDCEDSYPEEEDKYRIAVIKDIRAHGYKFSGDMHQHMPGGCPIFSDLTMMRASMRYWGGVMAEALNEDNGGIFSYLDWAWDTPKNVELCTPKIFPCYEMVVEEDGEETYLTAIFDDDMPDVFEFWWTKMSIKDALMKDSNIEEITKIQHTGGNIPVRDAEDLENSKYKEYIPHLVNGLWAVLMYTGTRAPLNQENMPWLTLDMYAAH